MRWLLILLMERSQQRDGERKGRYGTWSDMQNASYWFSVVLHSKNDSKHRFYERLWKLAKHSTLIRTFSGYGPPRLA